MIYLLSGLLFAYLALGLALTSSIVSSVPASRTRFRDFTLGAVFMPVIFLFMLLCIAIHELWTRLLIALDFDPPEEMRAGPAEPAGEDHGEDHGEDTHKDQG